MLGIHCLVWMCLLVVASVAAAKLLVPPPPDVIVRTTRHPLVWRGGGDDEDARQQQRQRQQRIPHASVAVLRPGDPECLLVLVTARGLPLWQLAWKDETTTTTTTTTTNAKAPAPDPLVLSTVLGLLCDILVVTVPAFPQDSAAAAAAASTEVLLHRIASMRSQTPSQRPKGHVVTFGVVATDEDGRHTMQSPWSSITPHDWDTWTVLPAPPQESWTTTTTTIASTREWQDLVQERVARSDWWWDDNDNDNDDHRAAQFLAKLVEAVYRQVTGKDIAGRIVLTRVELDEPPPPLPRAVSQEKVITTTTPKGKEPTEVNDPNEVITETLARMQTRLDALEAQQQEILLGPNDFPLLDFGRFANELLEDAHAALQVVPAGLRQALLRRPLQELQRLYKDQLNSLRDYYGRRYESILQEQQQQQPQQPGADEPDQQQARWVAEARHLTENFRAAAHHARPTLCHPGEPLAHDDHDFDYSTVLNGLLQDMLEATERRKEDIGLVMDDEDGQVEKDPMSDTLLDKLRKRSPPWLKQAAARAVVLAVNYAQGWLAWQGIKRAALERDRNMPKFPLF